MIVLQNTGRVEHDASARITPVIFNSAGRANYYYYHYTVVDAR